MANNPRVLVTLTPEQYAAVRRVAAVQGRSMSAVVRELVDAVAPVLARLADVGEQFTQSSAEVQDHLRASALEAEAVMMPQLDALQSDFVGFIEMLDQATRPSGDDDADPRPVITGVTP